jgi:hypothetical protein
VVNTEVATDADEPGLKVCAPVERVERPVDLQEDFRAQILSFLVSADELVGDIEDAPPVRPDDLVPGRLVPEQARLDELIRGTGLSGLGVHGPRASVCGERRNQSKPFFGLSNIHSVQCQVRQVVERSVDRDVRPAAAVPDA